MIYAVCGRTASHFRAAGRSSRRLGPTAFLTCRRKGPTSLGIRCLTGRVSGHASRLDGRQKRRPGLSPSYALEAKLWKSSRRSTGVLAAVSCGLIVSKARLSGPFGSGGPQLLELGPTRPQLKTVRRTKGGLGFKARR